VRIASPIATLVAVAACCIVFDGAAVVVVGAAAVGLGTVLADAMGRLLIRRRERSLGRRYFKTTGDPESIVWIPAGPFGDRTGALR
jgi:hypothetical protein